MKTLWSLCPHRCNRPDFGSSALGTIVTTVKGNSKQDTLKLLLNFWVFLRLKIPIGDICNADFRSPKSKGVAHACWPHVKAQDPCAHGTAAVRAHCADPAGRRRSWRLSSRRLSGAGGGGPASGLGLRHLDRRRERGHYRR